VDAHDRKEVLKQIVDGLSMFKPALEAFANKTGGYTWEELRTRLGEVADEHKSRQNKSQRKKALVVRQPADSGNQRRKSSDQRAADTIAAVSRAMGSIPAPRLKQKGRKAKKLCSFFRDNGSCKYGAQCHFSHGAGLGDDIVSSNRFAVLSDLSDANEKDRLVCAVLRFYDGAGAGLVGLYLQVLAQVAQTKKLMKGAMVSLLEDLDTYARSPPTPAVTVQQ
jgi:hypothetical protein